MNKFNEEPAERAHAEWKREFSAKLRVYAWLSRGFSTDEIVGFIREKRETGEYPPRARVAALDG